MIPEENWRNAVRAAVARSEGAPPGLDPALATVAIAEGTRRLGARATLRVAALGAILAAVTALGARHWSAREERRSAEAILTRGVTWIP